MTKSFALAYAISVILKLFASLQNFTDSGVGWKLLIPFTKRGEISTDIEKKNHTPLHPNLAGVVMRPLLVFAS